MQLRVARLCLDCEELHIADSCPVCASKSYAFLTNWLPSEERRRWRRPASRGAHPATGAPHSPMTSLLARWFGRRPPAPPHPRTRASDLVPRFNFDAADTKETKNETQPLKIEELAGRKP